MRRTEIQIGEQYELRRGRRVFRVTALETPPEVQSRGLVLVRYEDGVSKGKTGEQRLRFIRPLGGAARPSSRAPGSKPVFESAQRPPEAGDQVTWQQTGEVQWTVVAVNRTAATASISGELVTIEQEHTVPLSQLRPIPIEVYEIPVDEPLEPQPKPRPIVQRTSPPSEPKDTRKPVARIVDRLDFSEACLRQYKSEFEPEVPWSEINKRLRRELRNHGEVLRRNREYVRVRTHRFELCVPSPPSESEPCWVDKLKPLPPRRGRSSSQRKRAPHKPR